MGIADDVQSKATDLLATPWSVRDGKVVPRTDDVTLKNGAVKIEATYLYADMAGSSALAQGATEKQAAKIIRLYLGAASRIIRHYGGEIRSFDGDRVMAIFVNRGEVKDKNTKAVRAALAANWAVSQVLRPKIKTAYPTLSSWWTIHHGIGIDTGDAFIARGGVRDNNDLISIGSAPNVAAKLSEFRQAPDIYITDTVYDGMNSSNKTVADGRSMWTRISPTSVGGKEVKMRGSTWYWEP